MKKKILIFLLIFFFILIFIFLSDKPSTIKESEILEKNKPDNSLNNSNIIENVKYFSKDAKGNEYNIEALIGEIDQSNTNIIYLTKVTATIKVQNTDKIIVLSDYGKYNTKNFDTIFSKNVIITYTDNKIMSDYLDFSLKRNSMIVSKNVSYSNLKNVLNADNIEIDLKTKDTKIFMYEKNKKVKIKSIN